MRKVYIFVVFILLIGLTIYSFSTMPETIDRTYDGVAYKVNDDSFSRKVIVKLQGQYNKKSKLFQGKLFINQNEYEDCILSSATAFTCFVDGNRYIMGVFLSDEGLDQMSFEIRNEKLYSSLTNEKPGTDKLIISVPAVDRSDAVELNSKLRQYGVN